MTKTCFIISSIGKEGSDIRKIADEKYDLVFEPILNVEKYAVTRSDKIASPGSISREIVQKLIDSDLVIADVTDENPNVFYELAIRNAVKKPVIVFKRPEQTMPFDIYDKRAILIERSDPRVWEDAKTKLRAQIKMAENNPQQASESILSDFTFDITRTEPRTDSEIILSAIKDLQQEIRRTDEKNPSDMEKIREKLFSNKTIQRSITTHHVSIPKGTSSPGCETEHKCFIPHDLKIKSGETVEWTNDDLAAHTITSGSPADGPDGNFDSSLIIAGSSFNFTFRNSSSGVYPYYCMVHPWQTGLITVE